jgi:putative lipase involved disintegration of autophagic bodies
MMGRNVDFYEGKAHNGILMAASFKYAQTKEKLMDSLQKYPSYSIVITGHSLGAGTAVIMGYMMARLNPSW